MYLYFFRKLLRYYASEAVIAPIRWLVGQEGSQWLEKELPIWADSPTVIRRTENRFLLKLPSSWEGAPLEVLAGPSPDSLSESCLKTDKASSQHELVLKQPAAQHYFQLETAGRNAYLLADRRLYLPGTHNCRDLGGYPIGEGRYTKWGTFFRSDHLGDVRPKDLGTLAKLGIKTIVDFRSAEEKIRHDASRLTDQGIRYVALPIVQEQATASLKAKIVKGDTANLDGHHFMKEAYYFMAGDGLGQVNSFIELVKNPANLPLLFHCNAGKDRTGFAASLLLYALGASDDVVFFDYLLSNSYRKQINEDWIKKGSYFMPKEKITPFLEVDPVYLHAAYSELSRSYATVDEFFRKAAQWSPEAREKWKNGLIFNQ